MSKEECEHVKELKKYLLENGLKIWNADKVVTEDLEVSVWCENCYLHYKLNLRQINYKSVGATYKKECPDKDRHINAFVLPLLHSAEDSKEKCKICGNPLWSKEDMKMLPKILEAVTGISMDEMMNRKFNVLEKGGQENGKT